jgi:hypothetical protein
MCYIAFNDTDIPMAQATATAPTSNAPITASERATIRGATVTTEDGGRLNAFATEPRMEVVSPESGWGFHERAEKLNGRMAMLGFIALLATEAAMGGEAFTRGLLGIG